MIELPQQYKFLLDEPGPKMIKEALKLYGITEIPGPESNAQIMAWAKLMENEGIIKKGVYKNDDTAWCGLSEAIVSWNSGYMPPINPLWAMNWAGWGEEVWTRKEKGPEPFGAKLGYVIVYKRFDRFGKLIGGHVHNYVGEDKYCYHGIGGNQGNKFGFTRIVKSRAFAIRKPLYKIGEPPNVRAIFLDANGPISSNEG